MLHGLAAVLLILALWEYRRESAEAKLIKKDAQEVKVLRLKFNRLLGEKAECEHRAAMCGERCQKLFDELATLKRSRTWKKFDAPKR